MPRILRNYIISFIIIGAIILVVMLINRYVGERSPEPPPASQGTVAPDPPPDRRY